MANGISISSPKKTKRIDDVPLPFEDLASAALSVDIIAKRVLSDQPLRPPPSLPVPDFSASATFKGIPTITPPTPAKRKKIDAPTTSHWQTRTSKPFAKGSTMNVYDCTIDGLVIKIPELISNPNKVIPHLRQIVVQQKLFKERGFPVAEVVNSDTAIEDRCIVMEKFDLKAVLIPAKASQELLTQYKDLLEQSWKKKLVIDLKPDNLFVKQGKLVIVDWDAAEDPKDQEELPIVLRQAIRMSAGPNETLKRYLTPEGSNLWEGAEE